MAAKSTTPSNEQLEMDQMAEAELERLQKQVYNKHSHYSIIIIIIY